uniref:RRM domain-containing protein n=1 Tax=Peronospora matthiolae TaxID=2874970 RepID=A0AAV1V431_9STRA
MGERGGISLLVRNVSHRLRSEDIRKEFEQYGQVRDVYIPRDFHTKEPKGFAFVEFRSEHEADEARRNLDGMRIDGRDIRVVFAQERRKSTDQMRERERTERRGGDRRSRSRSVRRRASRGRSRDRDRRVSARRSSRSRSPVKGRARSRSRSGSRGRFSAARRSLSPRRSMSPRAPSPSRRSVSPAARSPSPSPSPRRGRSRSASSRRDEGYRL